MGSGEPQIDKEYLAEISGGDTEFEQELIQTFLEAAPALIDSYKAAVDANDLPGITHASHTLKGSSRSIGASVFAETCEKAERAARYNDLAACRALTPEIERAFSVLSDAADELLEAA